MTSHLSPTYTPPYKQAADVICTTCVGAGDPRLKNFRFRQVRARFALFLVMRSRGNECHLIHPPIQPIHAPTHRC